MTAQSFALALFPVRSALTISKIQFAEFQIEGLKSHIQIHSNSAVSQLVSKENYACKNSKPQGLEEVPKPELLITDCNARLYDMTLHYTLVYHMILCFIVLGYIEL